MQADQTNQEYTAAINTYTVSGNVGSAGVAITYTGGSTTSDSNGNYLFTAPYGWTGSIRPSKTGYDFIPSVITISYPGLSTNFPNQNFGYTAISYAIFGTLGTDGANATVTYFDGNPKLAAADSNGNYFITVSAGWSGTVTPIKTGYTFTPGKRDYTNIASDQTAQNFTTSAVTFAVPSNPGSTTRISVDSSGQQANLRSSLSAISANGRFVVFTSSATNLVPNDTNGVDDIFLRDLQLGITTRVSVASDGTQANAASSYPAISADGRFIAFSSRAVNLAIGDTNTSNDVFLHDSQLGTTIRVSVPIQTWGVGDSMWATISADGRYVAFQSMNNSLVPDYMGMSAEIYVRDVWLGTTRLASVAANGGWSDGFSNYPALSADGRYLVFVSAATNLVAGDTNTKSDLFLRDLQLGTTTRISVGSSGEQGYGDSGGTSSISTNGRYVAFLSFAPNLVPDDTNGACDVFIRDTQLGTTTRISVDSQGNQSNELPDSTPLLSMSNDGRYVVFDSQATNLVPGDTNTGYDIFLRDTQTGTTKRISVASDGAEANGDSAALPFSLTAEGRYVIFLSSATNLIANDTNAAPDIFIRENGYQISGNAGVPNATITYSGGSILTDNNGNYSFIAPYGWSGLITPSKIGYTFSPAAINISTPVNADLGSQSFTPAINTYTVSGTLGTAGATVTFSGTTSGSAIVSGFSYSFTVPYGWVGTITPSKTGYTFTPSSISISAPGVIADLPGQNFISALNTYTVSGALGVTGAIVTFSGVTSGSATVSGSSYSFTVPYGWTGTITPSKAGHIFTPTSITISAPGVTANLPNQNFTSVVITYSISGTLGAKGAGATVAYTGGSTTANNKGIYSFRVPYGWTGSITPSKPGYTFLPISINITTPVTSNLTNKNFTTKPAR